MATVVQQRWRDVAIAKSVIITDAWEVTKVYTGRAAEWILFGCMIANIVGILPAVNLPILVTNIVMGTQIITLDVAGFGLATMAQDARANGDEGAARRAQHTAYMLIGIMMLTLLLFSLGLMVPGVRFYTDIAEKVLILVRVGLIVLYGHVIHSLRSVVDDQPTQHQVDALQEQLEAQHLEIERISETHQKQLTESEAQHKRELQHTVTLLQTQQQEQLDDAIAEIKENFLTSVTAVPLALPGTLVALPEAPEPITEALPLPMPANGAVKPVHAVSDEERNAIIAAQEQGIARRKICAHLGWGSGKYSIVKSVLDALQERSGTLEAVEVER